MSLPDLLTPIQQYELKREAAKATSKAAAELIAFCMPNGVAELTDLLEKTDLDAFLDEPHKLVPAPAKAGAP